jgi:hypothetical protein
MLKDVVDGLKLVTDAIDSVTKIIAAVKSGQNYVRDKHPEVRADLKALVSELGRSMGVIKQSSAVLTNFRFAISADVSGSELTRFNDYFIQSKTQTQYLRDHVEDLRTHCSRIRDHATRISGAVTKEAFAKIFTFVGLNSPQREKDLGEELEKLAWDDFAVANSADRMLTCLEKSLRDVQDALGNGGAMYPQNVPAASALLAEYGHHFERTEEQAAAAIKEIRETVSTLD